MEWIKCFWGWIYHYSISLTLAVLQRQKGGRILAVLPTIQDVGPLAHMQPGVHTMSDKYSLLMHRIKIKSPASFFYGMNNTLFCVDLSLFNQSYSGGISTTKNLPDIGGTTQDVGRLAAMGLPGVHTMSDKQRVLMHGHQGRNVRHGFCHIYRKYVYMSCL